MIVLDSFVWGTLRFGKHISNYKTVANRLMIHQTLIQDFEGKEFEDKLSVSIAMARLRGSRADAQVC